MKPVWLLLISVGSASLGQVLFKKGLLVTGGIALKGSVLWELLRMLSNPLILSGLGFYVLSTLLWLIALSRTTLSFAYPFTALTFVLVMLSARMVFIESIPPLRYFGVALICLGIIISSFAGN